ncbi:MAG TPA: FecR domain-containing protein, partial [Puia sp.]|nr:FecR domain-containing protein [Puia sp.]
AELQEWMNESEENRLIAEEFLSDESFVAGIKEMYKVEATVWERLKEKIEAQKTETKIRKIRIAPWIRWVAAASIITAIIIGARYYFNSKSHTTNLPVVAVNNDVAAPKTTKATIILGDGKRIELDSAGTGILAQAGNSNIVKTKDGEVNYELAGKNNTSVSYNTLINPRGSKIVSLTLADGTKVWLNSESSIKFPTAFIDNNREVEITGEAYFEVFHNSIPFIVKKSNVSVEVLGTHFNVNAYEDEEAIKVTLLQGSVKVKNEKGNAIIKPVQQATLRSGAAIAVSSSADIDEVMAWKNGLFKYSSISLPELMRQAARWYDVDINYEGKIPDDTYT